MLELLESAISSPWAYLVVFAVALLDAFLPIVPSETVVITAGVFAAATGEPQVLAVIALASLGAFLGDHVSYQIGRRAGVLGRLSLGPRRRRAIGWAADALNRRGGLLLVVARYVPGGRTATTLAAGAVGYSPPKFALFDAVAAISWGVYAAMVGYLGGAAFQGDPVKGLLLGLGLAAVTTVVVEMFRYFHIRKHRRQGRAGLPRRDWPGPHRRRPGPIALRARPVPRRTDGPPGRHRMVSPAAQPTPARLGRHRCAPRGPRGRG